MVFVTADKSRSSSGSSSPGFPRFYLDGNHMAQPDIVIGLDKGEAAPTLSTARNPRSLCQEQLGRNALFISTYSKCPLQPFWMCKTKNCCGFTEKITFTPRTSMSAFTDPVRADLGLDDFSVYWVESNSLHLCPLEGGLKFQYILGLGECFLA